MKFKIVSWLKRILAMLSAFFLSLAPAKPADPAPAEPAANTVAAYDASAPLQLSADAGTEIHGISDLLFGIFFEDINFAADGGLYAEMVINRSFEFTALARDDGLHGWKTIGGADAAVVTDDAGCLNENNPSYLRLSAGAADGGIENRGYLDGMAIEEGANYRFSIWAKTETPLTVKVRLVSGDGTAAETDVPIGGESWTQYTASLTSSLTASENVRLQLILPAESAAAFDMVSLFPENTFMGRENGMRKDLAEKLQDLQPKFLRFPGGCVIEGESEETAYHWKDSVGADASGEPLLFNGRYGDVAARRQGVNLWTNLGTSDDPYPSFMSYGLGFYEYFQLAEDIGAVGLPVLTAGLYCQMRGKGPLDTGSELFDARIQDMLDLVEFCRGDESTVWGKVRVSMGHPEPFELKYIAIGNENEKEDYFERYSLFLAAFNAAKAADPALYEGLELVYSAGPADALSGANYLASYQYAKEQLGDSGNAADFAGATDQHYYQDPAWFLKNADYYDEDNYKRTVAEMTDTAYGGGIQVFLGEYAARSNRLEAALAEAAYMTGLERNGDIVRMAAYAPLFGNLTATHWSPDLIWFNNRQSTGSISYYMQKLFSTNTGSAVLSHAISGGKAETPALKGRVGVGTWYTEAEFDNVKVVSNKTGRVLCQDRFTVNDFKWNWENPNDGNFKIRNGKLIHEGAWMNYCDIGDVAYFDADNDMADYTYTVEATKTGGDEGFLIPFAVQDRDNNYFWNIGGWGNTVSCVQKMENGLKQGRVAKTYKAFTVETGKTYRIRLVVSGTNVKGYIDDELMFDYDEADNTLADVYTVVSRDAAGDILVKLVNVTGENKNVAVNIAGLPAGEITAAVQQVAGDSPDNDNILGQPEACKIETFDLTLPGGAFTYAVPKYSATVIRIPG
ncbi:MAG: carbohydrate binding domain-containing protein [Clostridia bacterium]|nr:carbohydrate binding domain-containing protein [Clostridia bacterium]